MTKGKALLGGCLCGDVRYRLDGAIGGASGAITLCHCRQCRKAQGGPAAVGPAQSEALVFTAGKSLVCEYESSPGKFRAFCGRCGSPLYSRRSAKPRDIRLRLGSLDEAPADLRIEAHIFFDERAAWEGNADAPRYPAFEPDR